MTQQFLDGVCRREVLQGETAGHARTDLRLTGRPMRSRLIYQTGSMKLWSYAREGTFYCRRRWNVVLPRIVFIPVLFIRCFKLWRKKKRLLRNQIFMEIIFFSAVAVLFLLGLFLFLCPKATQTFTCIYLQGNTRASYVIPATAFFYKGWYQNTGDSY